MSDINTAPAADEKPVDGDGEVKNDSGEKAATTENAADKPSASTQERSGQRADPVKRIVACFIDAICAAFLGAFSSFIVAILPFLGWYIAPLLSSAVISVFFLLRDSSIFPGGISPGKRVLGLKAVDDAGRILEPGKSVLRNFPLVVGTLIYAFISLVPLIGPFMGAFAGGFVGLVFLTLEMFFLMTDKAGKRWGDKIAGTIVVTQ